MSDTHESKNSGLLTFLGSLGGILIFALIIWIAYLPNRPEPVNAQAAADRQAKADEARAAGINKLTGTEVIDAAAGTVRIPIDQAMELTVANYGQEEAPVVAAVVEEAAEEVVEEVAEEAAEEPVVEEVTEEVVETAEEAADSVE